MHKLSLIRNNYFILLLFIILVLPVGSTFAQETLVELDSTLGPKACASCHKEEARAWKQTQHHKTYKEIPRKRIAKKRAKKMRFKQIKTDSLCVNCHFTAVQPGISLKTKTVAGISCESCHGGSKDWLDIHSDFGGRRVKANEETSAHKKQRQAQSKAMGMVQLSNIYDLAKNCYRCHTVPEEKLVNIGRHPAGSDFELVQWGQGEVRHNLWHDSRSNNALPKKRLRIMYVVGKALDLEYALRGLAKASVDGEYFQGMVKRKEKAISELKQIASLTSDINIQRMIKLVDILESSFTNPYQQVLANQIGQINRIFSKQSDDTQLMALDPILPKSKDYKGNVYQP